MFSAPLGKERVEREKRGKAGGRKRRKQRIQHQPPLIDPCMVLTLMLGRAAVHGARDQPARLRGPKSGGK